MAKIAFTFDDKDRHIEMSINADQDPTHRAITSFYMDFLRAIGYQIPPVDEPDVCDLALPE